MTTSSTPTPTPTLPADFTPDKQGCLRVNDYWIWDFEVDGDARTVLGGPSQINDCFPSTWGPTVTYAGTACPPRYTSACRGSDSAAAVTCCPTGAYHFACQAETWLPGLHGENFRCQSKHTTGGTIVVTRTAFKKNTLAVETTARNTNSHLFALAMMYTTPTSTSTSSTFTGSPMTVSSSIPEPSSHDDSSEESSKGLTTSQAAGVGVGVALGVILLASLVAWFLWYRRKSARNQDPRMLDYAYPPGATPGELPGFKEPAEMHAPGSIPHHDMYELPAK
ncbi:hypothetical protein GGR52DRAFT_432849 [Hypoxylon sp. FL1284]|nr:hypothetical protein GGR52DRAFT_432849 [Hypoxylon sp. FL1284]